MSMEHEPGRADSQPFLPLYDGFPVIIQSPPSNRVQHVFFLKCPSIGILLFDHFRSSSYCILVGYGTS